MQIHNQTHEKQTGFLKDPGNMLIICYLVVVLFFLLCGGLAAAKFSSDESPGTVSAISTDRSLAPLLARQK